MDADEFYRLLYDHYIAYQDVPASCVYGMGIHRPVLCLCRGPAMC